MKNQGGLMVLPAVESDAFILTRPEQIHYTKNAHRKFQFPLSALL